MKNVETLRRYSHGDPAKRDPFVEPPWDDLDARIRETVRLIWRAGLLAPFVLAYGLLWSLAWLGRGPVRLVRHLRRPKLPRAEVRRG